MAVIGVDTDSFVSAPEFGDVWLTSVLKNMDVAVFDTIEAAMDGSLTLGDYYLGTLENGGVGLADFHNWDYRGAAGAARRVAAVTEEIIDGTINTRTGEVGGVAMPAPGRTSPSRQMTDTGGIDDKSFNRPPGPAPSAPWKSAGRGRLSWRASSNRLREEPERVHLGGQGPDHHRRFPAG